MGTPLFVGQVEEKEDQSITLRLTLFDHQNYDQFGTDRVFAWKVLSFWLGLPEPADWYAEAALRVRSVACDFVAGRLLERGSNWLSAGPGRGEPDPAMGYWRSHPPRRGTHGGKAGSTDAESAEGHERTAALLAGRLDEYSRARA